MLVNSYCWIQHDKFVGNWDQIGCQVDIGGGWIIGDGTIVGNNSTALINCFVKDWALVEPGSVIK